MKDFKPGEMDISTQTETFGGFIRGIVYVGSFSIAVLLFLALFAS